MRGIFFFTEAWRGALTLTLSRRTGRGDWIKRGNWSNRRRSLTIFSLAFALLRLNRHWRILADSDAA